MRLAFVNVSNNTSNSSSCPSSVSELNAMKENRNHSLGLDYPKRIAEQTDTEKRLSSAISTSTILIGLEAGVHGRQKPSPRGQIPQKDDSLAPPHFRPDGSCRPRALQRHGKRALPPRLPHLYPRDLRRIPSLLSRPKSPPPLPFVTLAQTFLPQPRNSHPARRPFVHGGKENEGGNGCWVDDRAWQATKILSVAKVLSLETLHKLGDLLFGYLVVGFDLDTTAVTATTEMETKVQQLHERYLSVVGSIMSEIDQVAGSPRQTTRIYSWMIRMLLDRSEAIYCQ
jgi:hypothetical protein